MVEEETGVPVVLIGTGPDDAHLISRYNGEVIDADVRGVTFGEIAQMR